MDQLVIRGGKPLTGEIRVSGAKNAALPLMAATLLTGEPLELGNAPRLVDILTMTKLLRYMGVEIAGERTPTLRLQAGVLHRPEAPYDLVKTMRASVLVLGPLVARMGRARVSLPGGCAIGPRPINLHLMGLERLGASIRLNQGYVEAEAPRLQGARIAFDLQTVTGTENLLMAAVLAEGITILENAACEPEVVDLAHLLNTMGAKVEGAGTSTITIHGVSALGGARHRIIPDRIEAGTFAIAAAITGGDVSIHDCQPMHLEAITAKLEESGARIEPGVDRLRVTGTGRPRAVNVRTQPFPGFATDMQAQIMAFMAVADGQSVITEAVFENRFMHVNELLRMGADITIAGNTAVVQGVPHLSGAPVMATDLRASASLILAGLAARGTTTVSRIYHLDRGYEAIERKLSALGADIERVRA
ncbi:MAG TPA: UDP-N-acetylglucosamine 1-carboxyvinyltransferase [Candidatus Methylomirabilis sp.]|nr:UDP-N-acetylglucosamine 1-carboxyvinyltransferase [Candidatus Methylomirabilis sp.]